MHWLNLLSCYFGGVFLVNGWPHFTRGVTGQPFQTPFADPPGKGLSSATVNVLWGMANWVGAWLLLFALGHFELSTAPDAVAAGLGMLTIALLLARLFGRFHGGTTTAKSAAD